VILPHTHENGITQANVNPKDIISENALGPLHTQPLSDRNKNVYGDKIKHIFIVLVLPTKSEFKY
jgi:hypothetical protein